MLELLIVILILLWLLGYFGRGRIYGRGPSMPAAPPIGGDWIHFLIVLILVLMVLRLLRLL